MWESKTIGTDNTLLTSWYRGEPSLSGGTAARLPVLGVGGFWKIKPFDQSGTKRGTAEKQTDALPC